MGKASAKQMLLQVTGLAYLDSNLVSKAQGSASLKAQSASCQDAGEARNSDFQHANASCAIVWSNIGIVMIRTH